MKSTRYPIDEFRTVLGGQPTPFCFYSVSRVSRNCKTRTKQIKSAFPGLSHRTCLARSRSTLTTGRVKNCFCEFCCKKTWRWLATQHHAKLVYKRVSGTLRETFAILTWLLAACYARVFTHSSISLSLSFINNASPTTFVLASLVREQKNREKKKENERRDTGTQTDSVKIPLVSFPYGLVK